MSKRCTRSSVVSEGAAAQFEIDRRLAIHTIGRGNGEQRNEYHDGSAENSGFHTPDST